MFLFDKTSEFRKIKLEIKYSGVLEVIFSMDPRDQRHSDIEMCFNRQQKIQEELNAYIKESTEARLQKERNELLFYIDEKIANALKDNYWNRLPSKMSILKKEKNDLISAYELRVNRQSLGTNIHNILSFYYEIAIEFLNKHYKFTTHRFVVLFLVNNSPYINKEIVYEITVNLDKLNFVDFWECDLEIVGTAKYNLDSKKHESWLKLDLVIDSNNKSLNNLDVSNCILHKFNNNLKNETKKIILDQVYYEKAGNINFDLNNLQAENLVLQNYSINDLENNESHGNKNDQNIMFVRNSIDKNSYNILFQNCVIETKIYKREKRVVDYLFKSLSFQDCIFKCDFTLERLSFEKFEFVDCMFEGTIKFDYCLISLLNIQNCTFNNKITMQFCQISILAFIYDSLFKSMVSFYSSFFIGSLYLKSNVFEYGIDLISTSYGGTVKLSTSSYNGNILINYINFLEKSDNHRDYYGNFELIEISEYKKYFKNVNLNCFSSGRSAYEKLSNIPRGTTRQGSMYSYPLNDLTDFRISCSIFKDVLDKLGNKIDANIFYSLEHLLYGYELKLQKVITWQGFLTEEGKDNLSVIIGIRERKILFKPRLWRRFILQIIKNINIKLFCDKMLFSLNNLVSSHNTNLFRAILSFIVICCLGTVFSSWIDSVGFWKALVRPKFWFSAKLSFNFDYLFKIIFPFEGIPNEHVYLKGGLLGKNKIAVNFSLAFFKVISIYIIWQIIKTTNRNFKR